jgi:hypothetical protein
MRFGERRPIAAAAVGDRHPPAPVTRSAISRPIASAAVAAGDGALSTWTARSPRTTWKSSTRLPRRSSAWARTPLQPRTKSPAPRPGARRRTARTNARRLNDRQTSPAP